MTLVDRQPEARRKQFLDSLSKAQVVVQHMETKDGGKGNDRGFLWRLNTCWRYQEKNGGV